MYTKVKVMFGSWRLKSRCVKIHCDRNAATNGCPLFVCVTALHVSLCFSASLAQFIPKSKTVCSCIQLSLWHKAQSKVVLSDMGRVFHIWRVILSENSWMIMLSRALHERMSCTDMSLHKQAERITSLHRFLKQMKKKKHPSIYRPYWEPSPDTAIG